MMVPRTRHWILECWIIVALLTVNGRAFAVPGCPFCAPSEPPYSQRLANCDAALEVKWVSLKSAEKGTEETTSFEVVTVFRSPEGKFKAKDTVTLPYGRNGQPGDPFMLIGSEVNGAIEWGEPIALAGEYLYTYIHKVPPPESPDRLAFFLKFLEFPDTDIRNDAYAEFSRAQFKDIAALAPKFPRKKIREWLSSADPQIQVRLGLYGMMLGLAGDDSDAEFLEKLIMKAPDPDKPRFGIDGMMAGYLLIRGERGLQKLVDAKFDDPRSEDDLVALRNTLMFLWDYGQDRIPRDAVVGAMRRFLDRPKLAVNVIENLARWQDWQSLDPLLSAYGKPPFDSSFSRQKIVVFALMCEIDGGKKSPEALPVSAIKARHFLNGLDRDLVKGAERLLNTRKPEIAP